MKKSIKTILISLSMIIVMIAVSLISAYASTLANLSIGNNVTYETPTHVTTGEDTILFGSYPQTLIEDGVSIDPATTKTQGELTYYKGSDDEWYAKVVADPHYSGYEFSDETIVTEGSTYYFKEEPIKWRVLTEDFQGTGDSLILCDSIINNKAFDATSNNYEDSEIRAWLNDQFYDTAFTDIQKELIQTTKVDNSLYSTGDSTNNNVCEDTLDKIFLPSYEEVFDGSYGFDDAVLSLDTARRCVPSDFSKASGAGVYVDGTEYYGNGYWWLRTPYNSSTNEARYVSYGGGVTYEMDVKWTNYGVVPALVLKDENNFYFGSYPQTLKEDGVAIYGTKTKTQGELTYYQGNDGEWYAKVDRATPHSTGYTFSNNTSVNANSTYYFKVEPIRWKIMTEDYEGTGNTLLLCDSIIQNKAYDEDSNNYKDSDVRAWLNDQFYDTAFTDIQKELIVTTNVDNSASTTNVSDNIYACENTNDKIFLPSYQEVNGIKSDYGTEDKFSNYEEAKLRVASDYIRAKGGFLTSSALYKGKGGWWLRSPDNDNSTNSLYMNIYGHVRDDYNVNSAYIGISPAIVIKNEEKMLFGSYPQTIKEDDVTIDQDTTKEQGELTYYQGSDNEWYAKVVADPFEVGYKFSNETHVTEGNTYYFKEEPIEWKVLTKDYEGTGNTLIICDSIIQNKRFDDSSNNYKDSEIRAWLNNEFYNTAFTDMQKAMIQTILVDNSVESTGYESNPYICENTNDKVFLPSYQEVVDSDYGFNKFASNNDPARTMQTSDFNRASGGFYNDDSDGYYGNGYWWLRSPGGGNSIGVRAVRDYGYVLNDYSAGFSYYGVAPALVISQEVGTVLFGSYAQTVKEDSVTIDESITKIQGDFTYYQGSDNEWYAKVVADPYTSNYKFSDESIVTDGSTYYFKEEPIKWRILTDNYNNTGNSLLLCDSVLQNRRFAYSSNNYEFSEIRDWLNNEFYNTAFTDLQKTLIQTTEVDNSASTTGNTNNTYACNNTFDNVFLPSVSELVNSDYGFNSNYSTNDTDRMKISSDYCRASGISLNSSICYGTCVYYLRSPFYNYSNFARIVYGTGLIDNNKVSYSYYGIVPALVVDLR